MKDNGNKLFIGGFLMRFLRRHADNFDCGPIEERLRNGV